jgi:hypothetical protein
MHLAGIAAVHELIQNRVPEGLQLEFKEKNSADKPELDNGDKKTIAKAVTALANSGGGTLVFGLRTAKVGDVDVAAELKPICQLESCRTEVEFVCHTNVSPEIAGLQVKGLSTADDLGVIVCIVPASERRPHMCTAQRVHSYYRRTFQGNVPMTPFEVQEQILAVREAVLNPTAKLSQGASFSGGGKWMTISYGIEFGLENVGNRACVNPFLRVRSSELTKSNGAIFDKRLGAWKSKLAYGTLIHVDDALRLYNLEFTARVLSEKLLLGSAAGVDQLIEAVRLYGGQDGLHEKTIADKVEIDQISFDVTYGAENSASRNHRFLFHRDDLAAQMLVQFEPHICERVRPVVEVWRSDLVDTLRSRLPILAAAEAG